MFVDEEKTPAVAPSFESSADPTLAPPDRARVLAGSGRWFVHQIPDGRDGPGQDPRDCIAFQTGEALERITAGGSRRCRISSEALVLP